MIALIVLVVAVASGVLTSGSRDGDASPGHPAPSTSAATEPSTPGDGTVGTPEPTATGTGPDGYGPPPAAVVASLVGVWVSADGTLELTIGSDGSFRLTQDGTTTVSGDLASRDSTLSLITDAGDRRDVVVGSAGGLTLVSPSGERVDLTRTE
jgi:hypothetical protein